MSGQPYDPIAPEADEPDEPGEYLTEQPVAPGGQQDDEVDQ